MATDFSRVRSNPLLDYSGVQLKQGAVLLDADANQLTAIADRRLRALASDVLGRATVGANTPDAFRITLGTTSTGAQTLNIGPGRHYVDGLLAENHGKADPAGRVFDDLMGEERFTNPVPYEAQPYLPNPPPLPRAGRHLVYLDVWNREVTQLENPDLVEVAVGVETGSRLQTVWQVRVLGDESGADTTCGSPDADLPGWADLIAPSSGRLTTGTYEVAAVDDPCELPPTGGYRGLENQLYRVEIHDPGQPGGTATFKWSRDNASIGSRVASIISSSELELESLGRDEVLRFNTGDFVEVIDDVREFAQLGGEMRSITVANATRRITLSAPLPDDMMPAGSPPPLPDSAFPKQRNLRVRLWSQRDVVLAAASNGATTVFQDLSGSNGLIKVPAAGTTLLLENGVTVSFDNVGQKGFRAGDYWVFAARTADASVEILDQAPPRGIHHHYARLGLWDAGTNTEPTDCRHHWPPTGGGEDCACTQCVTPESHASGKLTIEEAVNRVRETGGTVCLKAGQYALRRAVPVGNARSVRIRGEGINTMLLAPAGAFAIDTGIAVAIENLAMTTTGKLPAISVRSGYGISLRDLFITVANPAAPASAVALSGVLLDLAICNNWITAPFGIRALDPTAPEPFTFLWTAGVRIENNRFSCARQAISFTGFVAHLQGTSIRGNEISGCQEVGIALTGAAYPGSAVRITDNTLLVNGRGISCGTNFGWIENNHVTAMAQENRAGAGITIEAGLDPDAREQYQLLANQVDGFPDAGILINASVQDLICKLNIIRNCGNGIVTAAAVVLGSVSIENNHLRDIGTPHAPLQNDPFIYGISVRRAQTANVAGNQLQRVGIDAPAGIQRIAGIAHFAVRSSRVTNNDIAEVGPAAASTAIMSGIEMHGPHEDHVVAGNQVARDPAGAIPDGANWFALLVDEPSPPIPIVHAGNFTAVHLAVGRTLVLDGTHAFATEAVLDAGTAAAPLLRLSSVMVEGNVLRARGAMPAVLMITGLDIKFSDNRCTLNGNNTAVVLNCRVAVVSSNIVRGLGRNSVEVPSADVQATVIGNVTSGEIFVRGQPLPAPWAPLNVRI